VTIDDVNWHRVIPNRIREYGEITVFRGASIGNLFIGLHDVHRTAAVWNANEKLLVVCEGGSIHIVDSPVPRGEFMADAHENIRARTSIACAAWHMYRHGFPLGKVIAIDLARRSIVSSRAVGLGNMNAAWTRSREMCGSPRLSRARFGFWIDASGHRPAANGANSRTLRSMRRVGGCTQFMPTER